MSQHVTFRSQKTGIFNHAFHSVSYRVQVFVPRGIAFKATARGETVAAPREVTDRRNRIANQK